MDLMPRLMLFAPLDALATALLVGSAFVMGYLCEHPPRGRPSVSILMEEYRRDWMRQFVTRQPRIFDATIIDSLRQGTAFFASACMIAIGGAVALLGNTERVAGLAADLSFNAEALVIEVKIIFVVLFIASALLKFIWAHRLFGYCSVLMGAVPNDPADPQAFHRAAQAAEVNITAARAFNRGIRSIFFALSGLGWLAGPEALIATTLITVVVLGRREFASHSRDVMAARSP